MIYTKTTDLFVTTTNIATVVGNDPTGAPLDDAASNPVTVTVEDVCPPGTNCVPEFPSLALPIGMILGIAFVAYSLSTKRKD